MQLNTFGIFIWIPLVMVVVGCILYKVIKMDIKTFATDLDTAVKSLEDVAAAISPGTGGTVDIDADTAASLNNSLNGLTSAVGTIKDKFGLGA